MLATLQIVEAQPIAHAIFLLSLVCVAGLLLGSVKYRGIALGSAGVVFAGILIGHLGEKVNRDVLDFAREFGLVLFVFTIGLQLGPGFRSAMREQGMRLNILAATAVLLSVVVTLVAVIVFNLDVAAAVGLFSGATTNTPSLGAAQEAIRSISDDANRAALPAVACAVAYPAGIAMVIASILILRSGFKINLEQEAARFSAQQRRSQPIEHRSFVVQNPGIEQLPLEQVPGRRETGVVISRLRHPGGETELASGATAVHRGDVLLAVGTPDGLRQFSHVVGPASEQDLSQLPGGITSRRIVVTHKDALGKTVDHLGFEKIGVNVTRISRGDLEMTAVPDLPLRFGDVLQIVGRSESIASAASVLGNCVKKLDETQFVPLFIGIVIGILIGLFPIPIPGMRAPVRLGLAGGPLIAGIFLGRVGHFRSLVWHIPQTANVAIRELGITLFLAAVGLKAGEAFFATVFTRTGLIWLLVAIAITIIPLLVTGLVARYAFKLNFITICGTISGATTNPPALAFVSSMSGSSACHVAYATVYPFTMLLRILAAQTMVLVFCR